MRGIMPRFYLKVTSESTSGSSLNNESSKWNIIKRNANNRAMIDFSTHLTRRKDGSVSNKVA